MRGIAALAAVMMLGGAVLGVATVPQPYRAWLVVWALVGLPIVVAGLRVARLVIDYRRACLDALERQGQRIARQRPPARPLERSAGLRVVRQEGQAGSGRHTIG